MKIKNILILCFSVFGANSFGHDQIVHQAITANAAISAYAYSSAYSDFLNTIASDNFFVQNATNSMVGGSFDEDYTLKLDQIGGNRSLNHFYDPIRKSGLNDWGWPTSLFTQAPLGQNSFDWGSISNEPSVPHGWPINQLGTYNIWSWQNVRYYEWLGLTATYQSVRQTNLANMFRGIGQVMHLLQDTSQPQHVRDEQHLDVDPLFKQNLWSRSAIEDYGGKHVNNLNYAHGMLDWRGAGFTQLKDFWDRDFLRTGGRTALNADLSGGASTLGLAEFTSGNFIGQRATYAEFFSDQTDIHYFAFPSLTDTTQPNLQEGNLWGTATHGDVTLENFKQGTRLYISKANAGVSVTYHSALSYLVAEHPGKSGGLPILTIADPNVLSNYHNIFIPKAVEYSAGLLDYFFRGTMSVSLDYDANSQIYTFTNQNTSGQDFYNGSFSLIEEDASGNRALVWQTNLSEMISGGILANSNSVNMTYSGLASSGTKFMVVYQGTIGQTNNSALDPVDANIGIVAARPLIEQTTTNTYVPLLGDLGLDDGSTISSNLESADFPITPTPGNFEVIINQAYLDDTGSIGGVEAPAPADYSWPHAPIINAIIPTSAVSIVGNHLVVNITATDVYGGSIGWADVRITWRVFYSAQ
jgi:hypothetical protein